MRASRAAAPHMTACAECRNGFWRAGSVWLTCSPNGVDFPSGTVEGTRTVERGGLYFRYSTNPQSYTHLLLAFVVLLSGLQFEMRFMSPRIPLVYAKCLGVAATLTGASVY